MVPKWDQCYRYEAKPEAFVSLVVALKKGMKPVVGQFIRLRERIKILANHTGEHATDVHNRWKQQGGQQKELKIFQRILDELGFERDEIQERQCAFQGTLDQLDMQIKHEQKLLKLEQQER